MKEAAWKAYGDLEDRLRAVAPMMDRASDALNPRGAWNGCVRAIAGFISGVASRVNLRDGLPCLPVHYRGAHRDLGPACIGLHRRGNCRG